MRAGCYGFNAAECNGQTCAKAWTKDAQINSFFSSWFLARMVRITALVTPLSRPSIPSRVPPIVDSQAAAFALAAVDDVDALSWATSTGDDQAVKVLLKHEANPNIECRKCISPL